ncbi:MAG: TIGR04084 family radical SAM/SPASM domain-containing protein [Candidatus Bathyarchaeales archaeon]
MLFHVILTTHCNLQCKYCYGKSCDDIGTEFGEFTIDYFLPKEINYPLEWLRDFCMKDPDCVLTFYGGEPTLCLDKTRLIMDNVRAKHFLIQTNGLLLDKLEPGYVNRFHTILISIDGDKELTDYYRGAGVYGKVTENVKLIRKNGFKGEIIARMTVMEETDIFKQVTWLLNNNECPFSSVHWQLDAGFWKNDFAHRQFEKWMKKSYNPGVKRLVRYWVDCMERAGKVLRIYPFLGVMHSLLLGEKSLLRCGSGWINYTIQTDGNIAPCPIMGGMEDFYLGNIKTAHPLKLARVLVSKPCTECAILSECGGRCLYANITKQWNEQQYALVCETVRNLINTLKNAAPRVRSLIEKGTIKLSDFEYLKYNGCEIIP